MAWYITEENGKFASWESESTTTKEKGMSLGREIFEIARLFIDEYKSKENIADDRDVEYNQVNDFVKKCKTELGDSYKGNMLLPFKGNPNNQFSEKKFELKVEVVVEKGVGDKVDILERLAKEKFGCSIVRRTSKTGPENWAGTSKKYEDAIKEETGVSGGKTSSFSTSAGSGTGNPIFDKLDEAISENNLQVVLTGAPGTGKTFNVREYVKSKVSSNNQYEFVQFHPSYDYTDFVEGLRPVMLASSSSTAKEPSFVRVDGVFKAFCRRIVCNNMLEVDTAWSTYNLETKREKFDGEKAETSKDKRYYFIIDEINRSDLSKVFGELMYGLEESYRGYDNRFPTQYSNLPTYEVSCGTASEMVFDCFENGFFIPKNLVIIGTMNDIDKSVEAFDFALRRRFKWIDIKANDVMESSLQSMLASWSNPAKVHELSDIVIKMNEQLSDEGEKFGLSEAYHIGPSYFKKTVLDAKTGDYINSLRAIFDSNIASIIREYLRGRNRTDTENLIKNCRDKLGI